MWQPPQRIRHSLPEPRWPTAEEAAASQWFQPIRIGPITLAQRSWVPAMVPWRATADGVVTSDVLDWYERFARGRPGAIVVEATGVRDIASGPLLRIGHDRFLPGLGQLVRRVREASDGETRLFIQLIDFLTVRRRPDPQKFFARYLQLNDAHRVAVRGAVDPGDDAAVRAYLASLSEEALDGILSRRELRDLRYGYREEVTDLHLEHVRNLPRVLPRVFGEAARRARTAGFDGVELHYAHAYTMSSFLSATNDRDDGYGGSRENRLRLPLEVYAAVRAAVGDDYVVGCRYLSDEIIAGGSRVADAVAYGEAFAAAGMDFVSLSRGGKFQDARRPKIGWAVYPYTGRSGYECMPTVFSDDRGPFGRNVDATAKVRAAVRAAGFETPVVVCGGISTFEQAERILQRGDADIVGSARQSLADPDWFRKVRLGRGSEVRRCTFTNYCEGLDQKHRQVTCKLWDRVDLNRPDTPMSSDGRRRLVAPEWNE